MAKIAVKSIPIAPGQSHDVESGSPAARKLAAGDGWNIYDVVCTAGPKDRAFEEEHSQTSIALVVSGTFQYRTSMGSELMTPGSMLLGNVGDPYACGHEHGVGDRCISFHYSSELCEEFGLRPERNLFKVPRIPAIRSLSRLAVDVSRLLRGDVDDAAFQEIALQVADRAVHQQHGLSARRSPADPSSLARVTRVVRMMDAEPDASHELAKLAAIAKLSLYHFLRCFEELTGTTPRQYLLRTRLRRAAIRLKEESTKILEVAFDCGFGDVSNFNRAFRAEFGESPRAYRRA